MTHHLLERYLGDRAFYRLNSVAGIDNPDQRISEDINAFTQQSLCFLMVVLGALIELIAFTGVLWAIARGLLSRPRYVMLDEATSALDAANEESVCQQLVEIATTPVSVSHRASLVRYHRHVLELPGEGQWSLHLAEGYRFS